MLKIQCIIVNTYVPFTKQKLQEMQGDRNILIKGDLNIHF